MEPKTLKDHLLRYGLILGLSEIVLVLITYLMGIKYMVSYWTSILSILIMITVLVLAGVKWKKAQKGILIFKHAFLLIFAVYAISGVLQLLFSITLYNAIDPSLPESLKAEISEKMISTMEQLGTPEENIEEALAKLDNMEESYKPQKLIIGFCWSLIFGAVLATIIAAIIKKKPPELELS